MSTRRARIKAVASLPVRRKNVNDNNDSKESFPIDSGNPNEQSINEHTKANEQPVDVNVKQTSEISTITTNQKTVVNPCGTPEKNSSLEKVGSTPKSLYKNVLSSSLLSPQIMKGSPMKSNNTSKSIPQNQVEKHIQEEITNKGFYDNRESDKYTSIKNETSITTTATETVTKLTAATENEQDDAVFDGIVPLESKVAKPLETLKNQIISENAEVLFDPIVPLPSPNKGRPKLRPVPRLAPLRRNSIQGSASESEDENRRSLLNSNPPSVTPRQRHDSYTMGVTQISQPPRDVSRVRNDSVSSIMSQNTFLANVPLSPLKDNKQLIPKTKKIDSSRMMSGTRRRQRVRDHTNKESLTMYDLIFYNPSTNPIIHNKEEEKILSDSKETIQKEEEIQVEEPPPELKEESAPVPQIKLGPNGEIVIDEQSLVIKQTEGPRKLSSSVIHEGDWTTSGKGRYTRSRRSADWSDADTVRFYRALAAVGTDFSMMAPLFPNRARRELKIKFKKEEKLNCAQVDKALRTHLKWDVTNLEEEFKKERREEKEKIEREKMLLADERRKEIERLRSVKSMGLRSGKGAKAMEITPRKRKQTRPAATVDDLLRETIEANNRKPKEYTLSSIITKVGIPVSKESPSPIKQNTTTPEINNTSNTPKIPKSSNLKNIENGSLVVLSVNDPNSPTKKLLQTYISDGKGCLTPVDLLPAALNSVINYMNEKKSKGNPIKSPLFPPTNAAQDCVKTATPGLDKLSPGPSKRIRHDSYSITQL